MLYFCTVKSVRINILKLPHKSYCFVNEWFIIKQNRDYVYKIVKFNKKYSTNIMPKYKEEIIYSYFAPDYKLHLVNMHEKGKYQVRLNRRVKLTNSNLDLCKRKFLNELYNITMSNELNFAV